MDDRVILRVGAKILIPFILLFALYVQFHGDFGPGGGFQAGVIFAAGVHPLRAGLRAGRRARRCSRPSSRTPARAIGVMIYAGTGVVTLLLGGNFLDYNVLAHDPRTGRSGASSPSRRAS